MDSIMKFCTPTPEMEALLVNCSYERESEVFSDSEAMENEVRSPLCGCGSVHQQRCEGATGSAAKRLRVEPKNIEVVILDEESDSDEVIVIDDDDDDEEVVDMEIGMSRKRPKDSDVDGGRVRDGCGDISGRERDMWLKGKGKGKEVASNEKGKGKGKEVASNEKEKETVFESPACCNGKEKRKGKEVVGESSGSSKEKEKEKRKEKEVAGESREKEYDNILLAFLDALSNAICNGDCDGADGDFFSTAKMLGIEFPIPRWWPNVEGKF